DGVLAALLSELHAVSLLQTVPDAVEPDHPERERLEALAQTLPPEDVQLFYQIGLTGRRDLPLAPEPRIGFEMLVLRMLAFRPDDDVDGGGTGQGPSQPAPSDGGQAAGPVTGGASPAAGGAPADGPVAPAPEHTAVAEPPATPAAPELTASAATQPEPLPEWADMLAELGLTGMARALAMQCSWEAHEGDTVTLRLDPGHASLRNPQLEQRIQQALGQRLGQSVTLRIRVAAEDERSDDTPAARAEQARQQRQQAAEEAIRRDPAVTEMQQRFDAEVLPNSIQPAD
ncbi:MAG: DNA polymerase III subunit gamma/tau C-terminal domain-containing protein, partial [Ectothiorhodospiraceae bacterium]